MTTVETPTPTAASTPPAVRLRRAALVAMPVAAGVLTLVAALADPAAGQSGDPMFAAYAAEPGPLQIKSLGYHWAYAFWIAPALLLARYVTGRGRVLANVAAVLGFAGMTTLPGMLFIDWVHSATGRLWGVEGVRALEAQLAQDSWGLPIMMAPGMAGLLLALPLAAVALWVAGRVRWWAPLSVVVGTAAFLVSSSTWPGALVTLATFTVFAVAIERGTRDPRPAA